MSSIWSSTPRMSFLRFWGAKELKGPLPQLPYRTPLPLTPKLHRVPASLIFSVLPFWDLPGARWPGCSGPCAPRQHRPTPDGGKAGSCPGNVPTTRVPQRLPHPRRMGTSVMAIFFLSKDNRICCSSFWERGTVWAWAGPGAGHLLPPPPTWDYCTKDPCPPSPGPALGAHLRLLHKGLLPLAHLLS